MDEFQNYDDAVQIIKTAILQSQYEAARSVNEKQLMLYYGIGKYISMNSRNGFRGKGAINAISERLNKELPGLRGFSARNIRYMRMFYEEWRELDSIAETRDSDNLALINAKFPEGEKSLIWHSQVPKLIDLLFFNRELNCLVAVELKRGKFKPAYLGQMQGYLSILDGFEKKPHENPSIGIILCKDMNKSFVDYVIRDFTRPMGVATYKTSKDLSEELKRALPDIDDLKRLLDSEPEV